MFETPKFLGKCIKTDENFCGYSRVLPINEVAYFQIYHYYFLTKCKISKDLEYILIGHPLPISTQKLSWKYTYLKNY